MPIYVYTNDAGESIERFYKTWKDKPRKITIGDQVFWHDLAGTHGGTRHVAGTYPMKSVAVGVPPDQVAEARSADLARGLPADYCPNTGDKIWKSASERRKWCEAYGYYDRNAGYSDPKPRNK